MQNRIVGLTFLLLQIPILLAQAQAPSTPPSNLMSMCDSALDGGAKSGKATPVAPFVLLGRERALKKGVIKFGGLFEKGSGPWSFLPTYFPDTRPSEGKGAGGKHDMRIANWRSAFSGDAPKFLVCVQWFATSVGLNYLGHDDQYRLIDISTRSVVAKGRRLEFPMQESWASSGYFPSPAAVANAAIVWTCFRKEEPCGKRQLK